MCIRDRYNGNIVFEGIVSASKTCLDNDIKVGIGTDTACPFVTHYDTWRELDYFIKYVKNDNREAIYHATLLNAIIAGIDNETGSVEENKSCDLLIVDNNPLEDITCLLYTSSRIITITSELAPLNPLPFTGIYAITKSTLDKYCYSLRMELQLLGIDVSVISCLLYTSFK